MGSFLLFSCCLYSLLNKPFFFFHTKEVLKDFPISNFLLIRLIRVVQFRGKGARNFDYPLNCIPLSPITITNILIRNKQ